MQASFARQLKPHFTCSRCSLHNSANFHVIDCEDDASLRYRSSKDKTTAISHPAVVANAVSAGPKSRWKRAYDALLTGEDSKKLMARYEKILAREVLNGTDVSFLAAVRSTDCSVSPFHVISVIIKMMGQDMTCLSLIEDAIVLPI